MRILVLLKTGHYYVCSSRRPETREDYRRFRLCMGGEVEIPQTNILSVETYTDTTIGNFRYRLKKLEKSADWTQLTDES